MKAYISCFIKKKDLINDFIAISNQFASLSKVCYREENIRKNSLIGSMSNTSTGFLVATLIPITLCNARISRNLSLLAFIFPYVIIFL